MPLKRYEIRNEYSLGNPELYKVADKDDPEAILEGVAMAALVGVLRQLGDLAQFAAEIFHDLHEEVMSTAARGHGMINRVQQVEAEFPLIERKLLSQTSHTSFLYNSGVDWLPNLRSDQNTVTQGDLPRIVMDSYEECRGPPRLFLLDKFDVAGAGACLKRFTDPSFFKTEYASSTGRKLENHREKKSRRVKKRGPSWRNGETPESFSSSHAKLHQLFLEERIESGGNAPDRHVKLKKRQFTGSLFNQENTKSYMERFLDTCPPEQKIVHEIADPLPLTWIPHNASESSPEIVEIGTVSPLKESIEYDQRLCSSPEGDVVEKAAINEFCGRNSNLCIENEALEMVGVNCSYDDDISSTITQAVNGDNFVDRESKSRVSTDDICSEIDDYVDALAIIESEVETDSESKKYSLKPDLVDSDGSLEQQKFQSKYMDSQSVSNSSTSEDGSNLFGDRKDSSSCSSIISFAKGTTNFDEVVEADPSISGNENSFSESDKHLMARMTSFKADGGDVSDASYLPYTKLHSLDLNAHLSENSLQIDQVPNFAEKTDSECSIHVETENISGVNSNTLVDAQNTSDPPQIESHSAYYICSSIEEHVKDLGPANVDACSDSTRSLKEPSVLDAECPAIFGTICAPTQGDFTLLAEGNSNKSLYALDSEKSFDIQEKNSETIHYAPSSDIIATLCSEVDPSHEVEPGPTDHGQKGPSSGITKSSEIVECSSLEFAIADIDSSGNVVNNDIFPPYADEERMDDSLMIGKPSSSLNVPKSGDDLQKLPSETSDAVVSEYCQAKADEHDPDSGTILNGDSVSVGKVSRNVTVNMLERDTVCQDFIAASPDQTIVLDTMVTSGKIEDENNDFSYDIESGYVTVTEKDADLETDAESIVPSDIVADNRPANSKDYHNSEIFQDQLLSVSAECHQNGDDVIKGHGEDLTENTNIGPVLDGPAESRSGDVIIGANHALVPERQLVYPPDFPIHSTPSSDHETNLEPPPLPPLPPMQWRLGRFQNPSSAPESRLQTRAQQMDMSGVHHALRPAGTMSPLKTYHTLPPVAPITLPTLEHQTMAIAQTSWAEDQLGSSNGYVALQGVTMPIVHTISEGFPLSGRSAFGRQEHLIYSIPTTCGYMALQGGFTLPMLATTSDSYTQDNLSVFDPSTSSGSQIGTQIYENFHQYNVTPPNSDSSNGGPPENNLALMEARESAKFGASIELPVRQPSPGFVASEAERTWLSTYDGIPTHAGGNTNGSVHKKLPRPRNPLIDEVAAIDKSKFRKVERVKPSLESKVEEMEARLEQMQLRKVEKVKPPVETNASEGGYVLEHLQLRKVGERVKPPVEPKSEKREFLPQHLKLKKVAERYKPEFEPKAEETGSPRVRLKKVSERVKREIEAGTEETESPRVQLRKVTEKFKDEIEARNEETGSPRVQLRKIPEKTQTLVESKPEERDSLFEQIRNKSFSLKPAVAARPNFQGPRTNLKVAAILEKASNIRQAMVGSDEDDDADTWE